MSDIAPIHSPGGGFASAGRLDAASPASPAQRNGTTASAGADSLRAGDEIAISEHALLMSRIRELPEVREELVDRVRGELEADPEGFVTEEKLAAAAERLGEELDLFG